MTLVTSTLHKQGELYERGRFRLNRQEGLRVRGDKKTDGPCRLQQEISA